MARWPEPPADRTAAEILASARQTVEPAYRAAIDSLPAETRHVAGYHIGWWDADGREVSTAGKAIRPTLTLACARAASTDHPGDLTGSAASDPVVAAAVAVELVHDFSLLHDDVMDGDVTRRHRPTAWMVFGTPQAILVGDMLLIAAIQQLATHLPATVGGSAVRVMAAAVQELCAGQSADLAFEQRGDVSLAECLAMAQAKTGALLGAACQLGALAAGADSRTAAGYREFGRQLGLAFQLIDDLLGIWGDQAVTGKPVGSDLVARKKTLPIVAALSSCTQAGRKLARLYDRAETADQDIATTARLIEQAGGREWAAGEAQRRLDAALRALHRVDPDAAAATDLHTLAALITHRDH